jgi:hypothetical protein
MLSGHKIPLPEDVESFLKESARQVYIGQLTPRTNAELFVTEYPADGSRLADITLSRSARRRSRDSRRKGGTLDSLSLKD